MFSKPQTTHYSDRTLLFHCAFMFLCFFQYTPLAYAQDNSCVDERQFLKGNFSATSVPCDPSLSVPLKYCNAASLDIEEKFGLHSSAEFGEFLVIDWPKEINQRIPYADLMRLAAVVDDEDQEDASELLFVLYTAILKSTLSDFAAESGIDLNFYALSDMDLTMHYFPFRLPKTFDKLKKYPECVVRCSGVKMNMKKLTRSAIFATCVGDE